VGTRSRKVEGAREAVRRRLAPPECGNVGNKRASSCRAVLAAILYFKNAQWVTNSSRSRRLLHEIESDRLRHIRHAPLSATGSVGARGSSRQPGAAERSPARPAAFRPLFLMDVPERAIRPRGKDFEPAISAGADGWKLDLSAERRPIARI